MSATVPTGEQLPLGLDEGVTALAEAQHVDLVRDQAVAIAIAETALDRLMLQEEIRAAGTGESIVRDLRHHSQMSLRQWVRHCGITPGHTATDVEVLTPVYGPPTPLTEPSIEEQWPPRRTAKRAGTRRRRRGRAELAVSRALPNDPEIRRRMAGAAGEPYRADDEET